MFEEDVKYTVKRLFEVEMVRKERKLAERMLAKEMNELRMSTK